MEPRIMIDIVNLFKCYKRIGSAFAFAVLIRKLQIFVGEFVVLAGQSGSGKTTLAQQLGLLERPTKCHRFSICGQDAQLAWARDSVIRRLRRQIGFAAQRPELLASLTVAENAALPLNLMGQPGSRSRVEEVLEALSCPTDTGKPDLLELMDRSVDKVSGGQAQRLGVARSIIHKPSLLIADEPTSNLDPVTAEKVVSYLDTYRRRFGTTVVLITHDEPLVRPYATRVLRMGSNAFGLGTIVADDSFSQDLLDCSQLPAA